ncbi:hypothetical protein KY290_025274 [Solanum tuberosum]|uniref:Uncharacterized protein n=1 Tax=Solanum tuberosum TaxID=4113 RepID=A0ABQ7UUX6_SOLTU|nr:hypothetical protein KY284_024080 [Solanum tuberosum]KAH0755004.1 hypothetical protein KY290_025274 [Solanum tuberosum]
MEPFQDPLALDQYKRKLGFDNALANYSEKIWIFWRDDWEVYARCNALDRLELWEELEGIAEDWRIPWMEAIEFALCISSYALTEVKLSGSKYTWWNGRIDEACIFKRLDRILVNALFTEELPSSEVHHLIRHGSDHAHLHMICDIEDEPVTKHHQFKEVVQQHWRIEFVGSPLLEVHAKLKRVKRALAKWSRDVFGNIFQQIATVEDLIKVKETQLEILPTV